MFQNKLSRRMVRRHLHIQRLPGVPQVLADEHCGLLADQQSRRVSVAPDIVRADTQIRNLEPLDTVDVQPLVQHAVLDDAVALTRRHGAGAQAVPGALDVALDPLLDGLDVALVVLELLVAVHPVRVEAGDVTLLVGLGQAPGPAAVVEARGEVAGESVGLGGREVQVMGGGG